MILKSIIDEVNICHKTFSIKFTLKKLLTAICQGFGISLLLSTMLKNGFRSDVVIAFWHNNS